jgi:hypothetical protein
MKIDADVALIAARWGLSPALLQAIVIAEGDIVKAVRCSVPVTTRAQALEVLARSTTHRMQEYVAAHDPRGFVEYFASQWAPVGAANDPTNLNANWPRNVLRLWAPAGPPKGVDA